MATASAAYHESGMSIGRVFQRAFSTIGHNPLVVLGIAALIGAIPSVLMNYTMYSLTGGEPKAMAEHLRAFWGASLFSWVLAVVVGAIVQGALTRAVAAEYVGQRASFGDCISTALRVLVPLMVVGFLFGLAIGAGLIFLVVPGIILMLMWSVAGPAVVVDRAGIGEAFSRSAELTKGFRWKIFALFLLLLVIYLLIFMVLGLVGLNTYSAAARQSFGVTQIVAGAVSAVVVNTLWGTIQPSLYFELRQAKEGTSFQNLEEVFA